MAEKPYYRRGGITITRTRAIFGSKSYSIQNITSTEMARRKPDPTLAAVGLIFGLIWISISVVFVGFSLRQDITAAFCPGVSLCAGLLGSIICLAWLWSQKTEWLVILCTAATEIQAMSTYDQREAEDILNALDDAMDDRG